MPKPMKHVEKCLGDAQRAIRRSEVAGGNETETRELRHAVRSLIDAVATLTEIKKG